VQIVRTSPIFRLIQGTENKTNRIDLALVLSVAVWNVFSLGEMTLPPCRHLSYLHPHGTPPAPAPDASAMGASWTRPALPVALATPIGTPGPVPNSLRAGWNP